MKFFDWNNDKNEKLKSERKVSFEEVIVAMSEGRVLDVVEHLNREKYVNQKILIVEINNYVYLVPFVENREKIFLKTIIPNRKATKKYLLKKRWNIKN